MKRDPRTPVIIAVGQVSQEPTTEDDLRVADDAMALMGRAIVAAADDSGATGVLAAVDTLAVVAGLWRYRDPAALIARDLGMEGVATIHSSWGGQIPVHLTAEVAQRIVRGDCDVAVVAGGEDNLSRRARARLGIERPRRREEGTVHVESWGPPLDMGDDVAVARGAEEPRNSYAVLDSAIRAARGESLDQARDRAAALWAGYAAIAVANPHAADRSAMTAAEIREPSESNRWVSWPYTKAMCANNNVDHAGAIILASTEAADRMGVPEEQRVYPHLCVNAVDTPTLLGRQHAASVPGLGAAVARLERELGPADEIAHLDLYACFPAIVTLTTELLGVSPERPLTVTGGLAFAGAPLNFAAGESIIAMVRRLRADPGGSGLVQGNGGHATKHSLAVYSTSPPHERHRILTATHDAPTRMAAEPDRRGPAVIDGVTVDFDREGPVRTVALVRFDDGTRTWANSDDDAVMATCMSEECVGRTVLVDRGRLEF